VWNVAVIIEKGNVYMELVGKWLFMGNVAVNGEKGNVHMELVGKCVWGMWQLLWRWEM
jgi:hypothetical protein